MLSSTENKSVALLLPYFRLGILCPTRANFASNENKSDALLLPYFHLGVLRSAYAFRYGFASDRISRM